MIYDVSRFFYEATARLKGVVRRSRECALTVDSGIVEIIGLCGYYTMISMTPNTFELKAAGGEASELV